ncbi:MLO-like protein 13 [Dorcoceras hygrometricum]|uniref:MLO-like protein n=1 Tax=Dorcoceras hygrometricum TaxID=472368 RepID=A0A2Z7BET3_9LAMI|nr:MLO-like protein 13 [Dorcoceras hygrometricum]
MSGGEPGPSFEYTPTWVVAVVCFFIVAISFVAEQALHHLGKCLRRKKQDALFEALQKLKEELMLLGFISLLLTVFQGLISTLCVPRNLAEVMLPCKLETRHSNKGRRLFAEEALTQNCPKGQVPFLSLEALHQLHIFIFILAVVYVLFCASTMALGGIKIREWRHWELSTRNEASRHHRGYAHMREFIERAGNYWRRFRIISWVVAFFKQFYGSVTKSDYLALRQAFIREHCRSYPDYDFHKYMLRTLEHDFRKIVGISWYLWLFVVIFLLVNLAGWHPYFWLSFLPLALLLIVGAKLEHVITELATDAAEAPDDTEGSGVRPSDELFWFHRPALVLYLIHFILFQNSFETAFLFWIWSTYGVRSCIMEDLGFIIPRIAVGVIVQVLCSYSTLPLYALVSQMGSMFKQTVFDEFTHNLILEWAASSHRNTDKMIAESSNSPICGVQETASSESVIELSRPNSSWIPFTWNKD